MDKSDLKRGTLKLYKPLFISWPARRFRLLDLKSKFKIHPSSRPHEVRTTYCTRSVRVFYSHIHCHYCPSYRRRQRSDSVSKSLLICPLGNWQQISPVLIISRIPTSHSRCEKHRRLRPLATKIERMWLCPLSPEAQPKHLRNCVWVSVHLPTSTSNTWILPESLPNPIQL